MTEYDVCDFYFGIPHQKVLGNSKVYQQARFFGRIPYWELCLAGTRTLVGWFGFLIDKYKKKSTQPKLKSQSGWTWLMAKG